MTKNKLVDFDFALKWHQIKALRCVIIQALPWHNNNHLHKALVPKLPTTTTPSKRQKNRRRRRWKSRENSKRKRLRIDSRS